MITCPNCGENNGNERTTCFKCHQALPKPQADVNVKSALIKETKSASAPMITSLGLKVIAWTSLVLFVIFGIMSVMNKMEGESGLIIFLTWFIEGLCLYVFWGVLSSVLYHLEKRK